MPFNGSKVVQIARARKLKGVDFKRSVFPNRTGNFTWDEIEKATNPNAATIEAIADFLGCSIDELFDRPLPKCTTTGDHIEANENSTAFKGTNNYDPRLLAMIEARDRQIDRAQAQLDKAQQHIDQLIELARR